MLQQMLVVIGVTILAMISPGPNMIMVSRNTLVDGRVAGLLTSLGVLAGNLVHIMYCIVGIAWLISQSPVAFSVLKYAGAAYMIYLGIKTLRVATHTTLNTKPLEREPATSTAWFMQGLLNNVLNPKSTLFYLGVFTVVITPATSIPIMAFLVAVMIAVNMLFWLLFVTILDIPAVRKTLKRGEKVISMFFGIALVALGFRVAILDQ